MPLPFSQLMMNTERLLKHAVQEKLAITLCLNKVWLIACFSVINIRYYLLNGCVMLLVQWIYR